MNAVSEEKRYSRVRVHSSIDDLPSEARENLESMLADAANGLSYKDMAEAVKEQCGIQLSLSAIGRYAKRYIREVRQIDLMMNRMRTVAEYVRQYGTADASACINALIQEGLMRRILDGQEDIAGLDIRDALKYSIQAQRAAVYEHRYVDQCLIREETDNGTQEQKCVEWLRGVLRNNPALLETLSDELLKDQAIQGESSGTRFEQGESESASVCDAMEQCECRRHNSDNTGVERCSS